MNILVDTDALIALTNKDDSLHLQTKALLIELHKSGAKLFLLPTTLSEFALISTNKIGLMQTKAMVEVWTKGSSHKILNINNELTLNSLKIYHAQTSKEESLFDCYIMAASKLQKMDAIFSFDKGYKKLKNQHLKLKLVSDLYPSIN